MREVHRVPDGKGGRLPVAAACLVALSIFFFLPPAPACAAEEHGSGGGLQSQGETKEAGPTPAAAKEKSSDEYGNVTAEEAGAEGPHIVDPVEPLE